MVNDDYLDDLETLNSMWEEASALASLQEARWATNERLANSRHITARKPGRSHIFVPKIQGYIRRKQADYVSTFAAQSPISVKETLTSTSRGAKILQRVVNHYLDTKINWTAVIYNAAYDALTYEFAPAYVWWKEEEGVEEIELEDGTTEKINVVVDSYPVVEVLPPENVRIDPTVSWDAIDDARYVAFSVWRDKAYADEEHAKGNWPEIPDDYFGAVSDASGVTNVLNAERTSQYSPFSNDLSIADNGLIEVRVHFYFTEIDEQYVAVMSETLDDRMVLSPPTPLSLSLGDDGKHAWPLVVGHVYPKAHEQYAAALPEQAESLQVEVNAIRNQRRDNVNLILNPEKVITADSGIDPANLGFSYPGKVVVAQNINGMAWKVPPDVTATGHNEEAVAVADMDRLLSEGPNRAGSPSPRKETATAAQLMAAGASAAVNLDLTIFATSFVEPVVRRIAAMAQQAAPASIFISAARALGIPDGEIDPIQEASTGNFIFNVYAGSTQAELNNEISNTTNIAALVQQMYGPNANYAPIVHKVLEAAGYDPESIIPNPASMMDGTGVPNMAEADMGGVEPGAEPNMQPRQAIVGGGFQPEGGAQ